MIASRLRMPMITLAAAAGAVAAACVVLSRPEALIGASFEAALAKAHRAEPLRAALASPRLASEPGLDLRHIRPSNLEAGQLLSVLGPLKVGERVRIATDAGEQMLEVTSVHPLSRALSRGALGTEDDDTGRGLVLVTLRADDDSGATVRLLVEEPIAPALPAPAVSRRAL